ncbi:unnamed protein product, partial [Arabidopsis halleri]
TSSSSTFPLFWWKKEKQGFRCFLFSDQTLLTRVISEL